MVVSVLLKVDVDAAVVVGLSSRGVAAVSVRLIDDAARDIHGRTLEVKG